MLKPAETQESLCAAENEEEVPDLNSVRLKALLKSSMTRRKTIRKPRVQQLNPASLKP